MNRTECGRMAKCKQKLFSTLKYFNENHHTQSLTLNGIRIWWIDSHRATIDRKQSHIKNQQNIQTTHTHNEDDKDNNNTSTARRKIEILKYS